MLPRPGIALRNRSRVFIGTHLFIAMKTGQLGALLLAIGLGAASCQAAAFIKLGDIKGESTDDGHKDWINLLSFGHGILEERDAASGLPTGKRQHKPLSAIKPIDKASPLLMEACVNGQAIPMARMEFVRTAGQDRYYQVILKNVYVTSYDTSNNPGEVPTESFSLNYEEIKWTYTEFDVRDQPVRDHSYYWNLLNETGESDELPPGSFRVSSGSSVSQDGDKLMLEWEGFEEFRYVIKASPTADGTFDPIETFDPVEDGKQELKLPIGAANMFIQIEKSRESIIQQ